MYFHWYISLLLRNARDKAKWYSGIIAGMQGVAPLLSFACAMADSRTLIPIAGASLSVVDRADSSVTASTRGAA